MKNVHLLSTESKSKLMIDTTDGKLYYQPILHEKTVNVLTQNMYITSDESFKKGEFITDGIKIIEASSKVTNSQGLIGRRDWQKIVLTTDPLLIEHGVQAIDDDFLNWFVKNSDCEFVEVEKMLQTRHGVDWYDLPNQKEGREVDGIYRKIYKLIIPKKDEWISPMQKFTKKANIIDSWLEKNGDPEIGKQVQKEAEELVLENAAEKEYPHALYENDWNAFQNRKREEFKKGANWMAERMYSEEEVLNILEDYDREFKLDTFAYTKPCKFTVKEWFENNKK